MATYVRTQEIAHDIGASGRFALRATSPEIELRAGDDTTARVRVEVELRASSEEEADELFERIRFHVRAGDGVLEVTEPRRGDAGIGSIVRLLGIGSGRVDSSSVTAVLPEGAEIVLEAVSSDVTASGFSGAQQYRTVSGDLVLDRVSGTVRVRDVSGDVSIRAEEPMRLEMNTVSGDISAVAPRFEDLRLVTVSGDVELEGAFAMGGQHRIETVSGDLSLGVVDGLTLEVRGLSSDTRVSVPHRSEGSRDRRRYIIGGGEGSLQFSSMSGDASVHPGRRLSSVPTPPAAPSPPAAPAAPMPPVGGDEELAILRALEAGEIGVDEATARLAGRTTDADQLETILRLVADGRLTPEEATPIIDALTRAERADHAEWDEPGDRAEAWIGRHAERVDRHISRAQRRIDRALARAETSIHDAGGRQLRIQVKERGRQRVNLRIPIGFVDAAIGFVPGLAGDQADRIRDAVKSGEVGPIIDVEDPDGDGVLISVE